MCHRERDGAVIIMHKVIIYSVQKIRNNFLMMCAVLSTALTAQQISTTLNYTNRKFEFLFFHLDFSPRFALSLYNQIRKSHKIGKRA